jgi:transitional endoplasmic reticulum ATPase
MLALRTVIKPGMTRDEMKALASDIRISMAHFRKAIARIKPTTSRSAMNLYEKAAEAFAQYAANSDEKRDGNGGGTAYQ